MIFEIDRVSLCTNSPCTERAPCEEAELTNYGDYKMWTVSINTLEDLTSFIEKYGQIIIEKLPDKTKDEYQITIYDGFIE